MEEAYSVDAIQVDKVHCICKGPIARIAFLEEVPELDTQVARVAVSMSIEAFFEMVGMLTGVAQQIQEQNKPKEAIPTEDAIKEPENQDELLH